MHFVRDSQSVHSAIPVQSVQEPPPAATNLLVAHFVQTAREEHSVHPAIPAHYVHPPVPESAK